MFRSSTNNNMYFTFTHKSEYDPVGTLNILVLRTMLSTVILYLFGMSNILTPDSKLKAKKTQKTKKNLTYIKTLDPSGVNQEINRHHNTRLSAMNQKLILTLFTCLARHQALSSLRYTRREEGGESYVNSCTLYFT